MYIEVKQDIRCSKCDSTNFETFADSQYQGLRCKDCGHEKKDLHPHLTQTTSTISWSKLPERTIKF
jgi:DNA-directed RNA polymerase subunit RPC12/RpoP